MGKSKEVKILTLDTETYNGLLGKLKKIAIYDGSKVYYGNSFREIEPVILNYENLGYDVHIYIHNMEFDMRKIPELFEPGNIIWNKSLIISGKVAKIQCKHFCLHDSLKLFPMSLAKLSKDFKVEHGKLDLLEQVRNRYGTQYDITDAKGLVSNQLTLVNFLDKCPIDDPLFIEYLGYDVMSLYEVIEVFMGIAGLSPKDFVGRVSTASISRFLFKNGYKGKKFQGALSSQSDYEMLSLFKWEKDLDTEEFLRMSYCGGRTEVFKPRLEKPGYHYDVNSLYPFVMGGEFPVGKPDFTDKPNRAKDFYEKWKKNRHGLGFLNCHVYIPFQHVPPLPVKMGKLAFPCGHVYGTWTYEELEYAEQECGVEIIECFGACHFDNTFPVFKRFVDEFYVLKEKGTVEKNEALRTLAKLILNVGYGYTGMRRDDKTSLDSLDNLDKYEEVCFVDREVGFIEVPQEINAEYIQVQVASYVTSRARLVLLRGLRDILERGGEVYYCDTDSIVSDIPMSDHVVDGSKLGYWDLEGTPIKGLFLRPKVYTELFEEKKPTIKFKGVSRETQEELDFEFYEQMYDDLVKGTKEYEVVEKNRTQMRSILYMQKNQLDLDYYETRDKKMNFQTVEKRRMDYKGNETKPYYFETLEEFERFTFKKVKKEIQFEM